MATEKKGVYPASVKIPQDFREELDDWLSANEQAFSPLVIELLKEHIKKHPITPAQKKWLTERKKKR
jgi:hypothetical protein